MATNLAKDVEDFANSKSRRRQTRMQFFYILLATSGMSELDNECFYHQRKKLWEMGIEQLRPFLKRLELSYGSAVSDLRLRRFPGEIIFYQVNERIEVFTSHERTSFEGVSTLEK